MSSDTSGKVTTARLGRDAYLYVRQSTLYQVANNTESTARQYDLRGRAVALGWPADRIHVIDIDQGHSGASSADREGFQHLVAEVSLGRAGIILGLECSRLARNNADWHRLLQICAHSDTLILDEDGLYDPTSFNDRLLLGMKGQMSEAELHFLRSRLRGGILAKARRGELRLQLPIGLAHDSSGETILDPDGGVRQAVSLLFDTFTATGSAFAVVKAFRKAQLTFPARHRGGPRRRALLQGAHPRPGPEDPAQPLLRRRLLLRPRPPRHRPGRAPPHAGQAGRGLDRPPPRPPPRLHHLAPLPGQPADPGRQRRRSRRRPHRRASPGRTRPAAGPGRLRQVRTAHDGALPHPRRRHHRARLRLPERRHQQRRADLPAPARRRPRHRRRRCCWPPSPRSPWRSRSPSPTSSPPRPVAPTHCAPPTSSAPSTQPTRHGAATWQSTPPTGWSPTPSKPTGTPACANWPPPATSTPRPRPPPPSSTSTSAPASGHWPPTSPRYGTTRPPRCGNASG